jgi:hypothetical protein
MAAVSPPYFWRLKMKMELNSGLFSVLDPCGYWVFDGLREMNEEREDEWHEEQREIPDNHPSLFPEVEGELTKPNLDWKPGHYETDNGKFLDIISRCWVELFNDRLCEAGIKAKAKYAGYWSPKEYNFWHDEADFTFIISKAEVRRLASLCLADGRFKQHLIDLYSSRDGFWSLFTNDVDVFTENVEEKHGQKEYERAVWQAVNFIMFPNKKTLEAWNRAFTESVYDMDFSETLYFVEDKDTFSCAEADRLKGVS